MSRTHTHTMATSRNDYLQREFNDHPSLASIDDYEPSLRHSPAFEIPSQHSGFRARTAAPSERSDSDSTGPWSPPAWRKPASGWFQPADRLAAVQRRMSREQSPQRYESTRLHAFEEEDLMLPANVPLPMSPEKDTPSRESSPEVKREMEQEFKQQLRDQLERKSIPEEAPTGQAKNNNCMPTPCTPCLTIH